MGCVKNGLKELKYSTTLDSLGFLYGQITHYLGYKPHRHEGKVTGLAAYGNPLVLKDFFNDIFNLSDGNFKANIGKFRPFYTNLSPYMIKVLDAHKPEDIAASLQHHCEYLITNNIIAEIKEILPNKKKVNVCIAGGIGANVKINQKIAELDKVGGLFVFPHMGDGGIPLGSAVYKNWKVNKKSKINFKSVYLGPHIKETNIIKSLKRSHNLINYENLPNIVPKVVSDIQNDLVVGLCQGRMEYGPRSLGNRSIIYHCKDKTINDWLNKRLNRTEFMPFAPSTISKHSSECFEDWKEDHKNSFFMTQTYNCSEEFILTHPAVVHVDGTARPQIVLKETNKIFYDIIDMYCDKTSEKALVNTSFNSHEEPIVCSAEDAITALLKNVVDVVYIDNIRVVKK